LIWRGQLRRFGQGERSGQHDPGFPIRTGELCMGLASEYSAAL
jgi:hypothetical protein